MGKRATQINLAYRSKDKEASEALKATTKGKKARLDAIRAQLKGASSFIYACEIRALIKCSIVGTLLNAAKKDVVAGDYGHATARFTQVMAQYLKLGDELNVLASHLATATTGEK